MEIEKIAQRLNISVEQAAQVKGIIKGTVDPMSFKSVENWVRQCYNMPTKLELKLCAINEVLEGYGVEYITHIDDTMFEPQGLDYINLGDTYTATIVYDHSVGKFYYTSYGDMVEADMESYA